MSSTTAHDANRPGRTWSLALRLTAWYVGSSFVILVAATVFLYVTLEVNLRHAQDQFLAEKVKVLRGLLQEPEGDDYWKLREEVEQTWAPRQYARVFARVLGPKGKLIAESPEMGSLVAEQEFPTPVGPTQEPTQGVVRVSKSGTFRAMAAEGDMGPEA